MSQVTWTQKSANGGITYDAAVVEAPIDQFYVSVIVPNASVIALHGTPFVIVPAQGVGTLIEVASVLIENIFGVAAFTGGSSIVLYYNTASGTSATSAISATFLTSPVVNQIAVSEAASVLAPGANTINQPLVLSTSGAEFSNGVNGTGYLIVHLSYRLHTGLL